MAIILSIFEDHPWRGMFADCRNVPHNWYLPITVRPTVCPSHMQAADRNLVEQSLSQLAQTRWGRTLPGNKPKL